MQHISVHSGKLTAARCPPWPRVRPAARAGPGGGRTGRGTGSGYTPIHTYTNGIRVYVSMYKDNNWVSRCLYSVHLID